MLANRVADSLEAASRLSEATGHPGHGIRPCVASLLERSLTKGDFPNRSEATVIVGYELYRMGRAYDSARRQAELWNQGHHPPLKPSEFKKAFDNGFIGKYEYGCGNATLVSLCIDEMCTFRRHTKGRPKRVSNMAFVDLGWHRLLSNRQNLIYYMALPKLEVRRKVGPGGLICANHKQIAETCGVDARRMGRDLEALQRVGLIEYKVGQPRKWQGEASEIRRVIPIPAPPSDVVERLKGDR